MGHCSGENIVHPWRPLNNIYVVDSHAYSNELSNRFKTLEFLFQITSTWEPRALHSLVFVGPVHVEVVQMGIIDAWSSQLDAPFTFIGVSALK